MPCGIRRNMRQPDQANPTVAYCHALCAALLQRLPLSLYGALLELVSDRQSHVWHDVRRLRLHEPIAVMHAQAVGCPEAAGGWAGMFLTDPEGSRSLTAPETINAGTVKSCRNRRTTAATVSSDACVNEVPREIGKGGSRHITVEWRPAISLHDSSPHSADSTTLAPLSQPSTRRLSYQ